MQIILCGGRTSLGMFPERCAMIQHLHFCRCAVSHCVENRCSSCEAQGQKLQQEWAGLGVINSEGVCQSYRRVWTKWRCRPWLLETVEGVNKMKASSMTDGIYRGCEQNKGIVHDCWNEATTFWVGNMENNGSGKSVGTAPFKVCFVQELNQAPRGTLKPGRICGSGDR